MSPDSRNSARLMNATQAYRTPCESCAHMPVSHVRRSLLGYHPFVHVSDVIRGDARNGYSGGRINASKKGGSAVSALVA